MFSINVLSLMYPYGVPLNTIFVILIIVVFILKNKKIKIPKQVLFFTLPLLINYLFAIATMDRFNALMVKELSNYVYVMLYVILLNSILNSSNIKYFIKQMTFFLWFIGLIVAMIGLYKFNLLLKGFYIEKFYNGIEYPWGTSLVADYNFYALGGIICIISALYLIKIINNNYIRFFIFSSFPLLFANVMFSGSRRALVVVVLLLLIVTLLKGASMMKNFTHVVIKNRLKKSSLFLAGLFVGMIFIFNAISNNINFSYDKFNIDEINKIAMRVESLLNSSNSISERSIRWSYAGKLIDEFSAYEILIGDGFNYLFSYGKEFDEIIDYPHNLVISTFLYGGLIGILFLFLFLYLSFLKYKNYKYEIFLYYIFPVLIFISISTNSIFSSKLFLVLLLIPFIKISKEKL